MTLAHRAFVLAAVVAAASPAAAFKEYQKVFVAEYAKGSEADRDFARLVRKAKCYVCHQGKEDRKNCNVYGVAVGVHLKEDDKKDKEKIAAMLRLVAAESVDASGGETFGERMARGELPGGSLDESKKEPPPSDTTVETANAETGTAG